MLVIQLKTKFVFIVTYLSLGFIVQTVRNDPMNIFLAICKWLQRVDNGLCRGEPDVFELAKLFVIINRIKYNWRH